MLQIKKMPFHASKSGQSRQDGKLPRSGQKCKMQDLEQYLIDSGLPRNLWTEAAQAAVYTIKVYINGMPTTLSTYHFARRDLSN